MSIRAYCRIPNPVNKSIRAKEGSCPPLLYDLFSELEGAEEINISAYLFNNPTYYDFLKSLAIKGCKVKVTSLPLLGYSEKELKVEGLGFKASGRDFAKDVYQKITNTSNMELSIFPHQYTWYGALYANGGASYSFHVKAIYAKFPKQRNKCIISSGNFMVTDPYHSENLLVLEGMQEYERVFEAFFNHLQRFAIPYNNFVTDYPSYTEEFLFSLSGKEIELPTDIFANCFFTAPFYIAGDKGSNHHAGNRVIELISQAKERVWVCAQHFHDLVSFDPERETIINAIYNKFIENPDIEFRFLKQVPHSSLADKRRAAIAETMFKFVMGAPQRHNSLVHDKFMIIDDTLLVSTANYTSTQFAFGVRKMEFREGPSKHVKLDNFSEVNCFVIIPSCPKDVLKIYKTHFKNLWEGGQETNIKL